MLLDSKSGLEYLAMMGCRASTVVLRMMFTYLAFFWGLSHSSMPVSLMGISLIVTYYR